LQIDSPYNTYKHQGCRRGLSARQADAIEAALYRETDYYFFFSPPDGTVIYNETLQG
jgi:cell division protein YceG involved in septum cleavage